MKIDKKHHKKPSCHYSSVFYISNHTLTKQDILHEFPSAGSVDSKLETFNNDFLLEKKSFYLCLCENGAIFFTEDMFYSHLTICTDETSKFRLSQRLLHIVFEVEDTS